MNLVHGKGARVRQAVHLVIVLVFFLSLVNSQSLKHNLSIKERNELK